jgi:hypothetical protein
VGTDALTISSTPSKPITITNSPSHYSGSPFSILTGGQRGRR